jgi:NAD(P)-dependent dehydrogenase (short-subunit alcohol dehydrogenase family)
VKDFSGKVAVVTGGGTGIGRELSRQLVAEGCSVAVCDILEENLGESLSLCRAEAAPGAVATAHRCDVASEEQVQRFRDEVQEEHQTAHINLLFNNAGIGGGGSFVEAPREEWDRTFGICWHGVYYCTRAFLPMLLKSREGHLVNTSSVNGFRATLADDIPHSAYSAAKFAVKGFSEALINDFRFNAPHLKVSVVMPGHVGSEIAVNTGRVLGHPEPKDWTDEQVERQRTAWRRRGAEGADLDDDQIRNAAQESLTRFRELAPLTPAQAATIILDGVREDRWRILVGRDAEAIDRAVRKAPEETYDPSFGTRVQAEWEQQDERRGGSGETR